MSFHEEASARTREHLIAVAVRLFSESGYERTTVQDIVGAAELTKGAFYHHFRSKDHVLRLIHHSFLDEEIERAKEIIDRSPSAPEALRELIRDLLESVEVHRDRMAIFYRERRSLTPEDFAEIKAKRDEYEALFTGVVEAGIRDGALSTQGDPRLVSFGIMGMCAWAHEWYRSGRGSSMQAIAESYSDMVLHGLATDTG
ncbi:TetR family transcriptional regulator [Pseudonocardia spinosispora]|uniref:TetR family transcriptional regulator n=1 Tax=Pseudonocardia spinosispora TaxID=103441 RepID=UPI0004106732|nr:TetR family transcriptional regulator [Pseudonocardia spinosispora]